MSYAKWETKENLKENLNLEKISKNNKPNHIGLPVMYDDKFVYADSRLNHSLVIGSRGSGKTQTVTLPMLKFASLSGESIIIHDSTSELYETTKQNFENNGYKIIKIDFDDLKNSNYWNPLDLVGKVYKNSSEDKTQELIEDIGYNLLNQNEEKNFDPFWINSAVNYFTGIILYALKNNGSISFNDLISINNEVQQHPKEFMEKIDKDSNIYLNLVGILTAPSDTRNSIFSVFNQKIKNYFSKQDLLNMMSKSDFAIENISDEKTAVYIISGNSDNAKNLCSLFISQAYFSKKSNKDNRLNIIIGDFYKLNPIKDFSKMLDYSLNIGIKFTIIIRGYSDLKNAYGKEHTEIIKMCFANTLYLLSTDLETLDEISKLCGENNKKEPLISSQELKSLKMFEGVYITTRVMPYRTNLLPFYKMENK